MRQQHFEYLSIYPWLIQHSVWFIGHYVSMVSSELIEPVTLWCLIHAFLWYLFLFDILMAFVVSSSDL